MLNKTQPRDLLRAAIAERDERQHRVEVAAATLARANDLLREGEAHLAGAEEAIASHRAETLTGRASSGGETPSVDVPENFRRARDDASENVTAAKSTFRTLSDDLDAARAALTDKECGARDAASSVLFEEAGRIAVRLDAAKREVWQLAYQLRGLTQLFLPSGTDQTPRPVRLSPQVLAALELGEPQHPPLMRPEAKQAGAWRAFHTALLADPEAKFGGAS